MSLKLLTHKEDTLLVLSGFSVILLGWLFFSLALFNFFVFPAVLLGSILLLGVTLFFLMRLFWFGSKTIKLALVSFLFLVVINGFLTHPTLLSGRDQGSISEAAIRLSQTSELTSKNNAISTFFDIYGPGLALNFPGFAYTNGGSLITQFPLAYTSFLAGFYSLFGITGLVIANQLLLFSFLVTLFGLLRLFVSPDRALGGSALAGLSFLPLYFSQFTLTENLAVFLFTFLSFSLLSFIQKPTFLHYSAILTTATLLAFTRIEGFALLALTGFVLLLNKNAREIWRVYRLKSLIIPALAFIFFFLRNFFINLPYYKTIGRALEKLLGGFGSEVIARDSSHLGILAGHFPVGGVLILYGVLPLFLAGILGYFILWRTKKSIAFLPLFIALPTLLYLFIPSITLDHPWMLRRYYFTLLPVFIIGLVYGFSLLADTTKHAKTLYFSLLLLLLIFSVPAHLKVLSVREDKNILPQIEEFSRGFSAESLILIDRNATGSGFALPTAPLNLFHQRQAVYIFNPEDISRIDFTRFSQVYLLTPERELYRYADALSERLIYKGSYTFTRTGLTETNLANSSAFTFPEKQTFETKNLLFQVY